MRGDSTSGGVASRRGNSARKNRSPCRTPLQEEGADLIDDTGVLIDRSLPHPVERLQVKLLGGLRRHDLHRGALDYLGDRLRVAEIVLLSLPVGAHILRRHQPSVVTKRLELATEVMGHATKTLRGRIANSEAEVFLQARI